MLYHIYGEDWFRAREFINGLYEDLAGSPPRIFFDFADESEEFFTFLRDQGRNVSLFASSFFVVVKTTRLAKEQIKELLRVCQDFLVSQNILVVWENVNKPALKFKTKQVRVEEFRPLPPIRLKAWLSAYLHKCGLDLPAEVVSFYISVLGGQTDMLVNELEKVALLGQGKKWAKPDLESLVQLHFSGDFFGWLQAVLQKDSQAISQNQPTDEAGLLTNLSGLINALRILAVAKTAGVSAAQKFLQPNPFWLKKLLAWSKALDVQQIADLLFKALELDLLLRSGQVEHSQGIRRLNLLVLR